MDGLERFHERVQVAAIGFDGFVSAYCNGLRAISQGDRVPYDWHLPSDMVSRFLQGDFLRLCESLSALKECDADEFSGGVAKTLSATMLRLGEITAAECKRFGVMNTRDFTWSARILLAVFQPKSFRRKHMPATFSGTVSNKEFQCRVIDRILVILRGLLIHLRDTVRLIDQKVERFPSPAWNGGLGLVPGGLLGRVRGLLMVRHSDGRYDYAFSCLDGVLDAFTPFCDKRCRKVKVDTDFVKIKRHLHLRIRHRVASRDSFNA